MREKINMAKIEYRPDSAEFYAGDNFYRSGELAAYCTANTCAVNSYEPIALKADVSEIENELKGIAARVAALEDSMPHKDNLRRQLKTLNYKREL
jgi:hypothetical protein